MINTEKLARRMWDKGIKDAKLYNSIATTHMRYDATLKVLANYINEYDTVLDIGTNVGIIPYCVSESYKNVKITAIDVTEYDRHDNKIEFLTLDLYGYRKKHDIVICTQVLEHLEDDIKAARCLTGLFNKHLIISVPSEKFGECAGHYRKYSKEMLTDLFGDYEEHQIHPNFHLISITK